MDDDFRAIESFSYTQEELKEMQEYAKKRMNDYLRKSIQLTESAKNKKIERNRDIYRDVR